MLSEQKVEERVGEIRRWSRIVADMEAVAARNHISPMESKTEKKLRADIDFLLSVIDGACEASTTKAEGLE